MNATHVTVLMILISTLTFAQRNEEVIVNAMRDEMKRSMSELVEEGYDKPFFISYTVTDITSVTISASLGGVVQAYDGPSRSKSVRLLVGDYAFNDESMNANSSRYDDSFDVDISMPLDNDYAGIRRSLWAATNSVYRSAARAFKDHQRTLKEKNKSIGDVPHNRFAKAPVIQVVESGIAYPVDRKKLESLVRELSATFAAFPDIRNSEVTLHYAEGYTYFLNSEGTYTRRAVNIATLRAEAQHKNEKGNLVSDQVSYRSLTPDNFPSIDDMKKELKLMAENLSVAKDGEKLEDAYRGPVLIIGPVVADILSTCLFTTSDRLEASNTVRQTEPSPASLEAKIGKKVVHERITVTATPKLKRFNGVDLLGTAQVDEEGVVPPDELKLIENGILLNLLNDRTATHEGQTSNGHYSGPAVIQVSFNGTETLAALKNKLISQASDDDLEYAIVLKGNTRGDATLFDAYKISLTDGKETLISSAFLKDINLKTLRKMSGASDKIQVVNYYEGRSMTSFILPEAIYLESAEVEGNDYAVPSQDDENPFIVENPLKK